MTPNWKNLFCVLLLALMGGPGLEAEDQISGTADAWQVSFTGPDTVFTGTESKFTCVTSCTVNVECTIGWRLSGGLPSGSFSTNKAVATWTPSKTGSQNFTCVARNETTGQSAEATKTVEVKDATVTPIVTVTATDTVTTTVPDPGSGAAQLTVTDTMTVTPTVPDPGSDAAQLTVTDTMTVTPTVPDPGSDAAQLTGPFAMILSLGLLMVLEI